MPRGDRTGPMGMGSMTGRGVGFCAGSRVAGYANSEGYGCGFGRGQGFRRMFYATGLPRWSRYGGQNADLAYGAAIDEKELLKRQADLLENQLNDVKRHLANLDASMEE